MYHVKVLLPLELFQNDFLRFIFADQNMLPLLNFRILANGVYIKRTLPIFTTLLHVLIEIRDALEVLAAQLAQKWSRAVHLALVIKKGVILFERQIAALKIACERAFLRLGQVPVLDNVFLKVIG
jgi:hypothetical protein